MKKLALVAALFALAIPAVTSAKSGAGHKSAAKACKAMRAEMGAEAFRAAFAKQGKRAMKRCVAAQRKAQHAAKRKAKKACKAQGKRGRALKRCVRGKLAGEPPSAVPAQLKEAVAACTEAREEDPEGFAEEYGEGADGFEACINVQTDEPDEGATDDDDLIDEEPGDGEITEEPGDEPAPEDVP